MPAYELMWKKYLIEQDIPQMTIWRMRPVCCIPKATNTLSEYVMLITFPLQQLLHESALDLRYTYISCLVCHLYKCSNSSCKKKSYSWYSYYIQSRSIRTSSNTKSEGPSRSSLQYTEDWHKHRHWFALQWQHTTQ